MDKVVGQKRASHHLYPPIDPFDQRMMETMVAPVAGAARRCGGILILKNTGSFCLISAAAAGRGPMRV